MRSATNVDSNHAIARQRASTRRSRGVVVGLIAFLTLVDLFAAQAILPSLVVRYGVSPGMMGLAVNASTFGMALSGLVVALFASHIDRRCGIVASLVLLSIPTTLLATAPDLATFAALRIVQGIFMAAAFTLTLAYLGEAFSPDDAAGVVAAYITGNVLSNLAGRLLSAAVADHLGLAANFYVFALLNLAGGALAFVAIARAPPMPATPNTTGTMMSTWRIHLSDPALRAAFAIGFCILFAFIGTFTFVNFVLRRPPLEVGPMQLGFVYLVFLPSVLTTPLAGAAAHRYGLRTTMWGSLFVACVGLALLLSSHLSLVLLGLVLVGTGTFFAQALATGFVGRAAKADRGAANGMYLACYFSGGLAGSAVLGQLFDRLGWNACVAGIAAAVVVAALLTPRLRESNAALTTTA